MAGGVNIKMGISGVAQFKKGIKDSQSAVKSLEAALKLNEAAMKDNANQEQYLQNKTELLTKQLEAQKSVVSQTEQALRQMEANGVSKTSAAFQNLQAQLYKAQTDFINIQNELDGVGESGEAAEEGVSTMNAQLRKVGEGVSWQNVAEGIGKITDGLEKAAKKAIDLGKKLLEATLAGGSWADDLSTTAKVYGMTPEELQRMQKTSRIIDTSVEAIVAARKKMNKGLGSGDKGVMGAFAEFGLDPGKMATTEDKFWAIGDAIYHMKDAEEQEVYAQRVFGRGWSELNPLFEAGRQEYEEMNATWNVVSDENVQKLADMDDAYQKLQSEWETFKLTILSTMADALTPLMETLTGLMEKFNEYLASPEGKDMMEKLGEAVSSLFENLTNFDPDKALEGVITVLDKFKEGLEWIKKNKDKIYSALKVIAGGFGLLKLTELAANIGRITSGLGGLGLMGKGAGAAGAAGAAAGGGSGLLGTLGKAGYLAVGIMMVAPTVQKLFDPNTWKQSETEKKIDEAVAKSDMGAVKEANKEAGYTNQDLLRGLGNRATYTGGDASGMAITTGEGGGSSGGHGFGVAMDRMTEVAGETDATLKNTNKTNEQLTGAVNGLNALPAEMQTAVTTAVENGMKNLVIVLDENCVEAIGRRISGGMGGQVMAMVR